MPEPSSLFWATMLLVGAGSVRRLLSPASASGKFTNMVVIRQSSDGRTLISTLPVRSEG